MYDVKITVVEVKGKQVRIGIDAPRSYIIHREEVYISIQEETRRAAKESPLSLSGLKNLIGNHAIGHNRYSTTGENTLRNIQPFFADTNAGGIGVAHNGNLTNSIALRKKLVEDGAIFYSTSDTETIVHLIAKSKRTKTIDKVVDADLERWLTKDMTTQDKIDIELESQPELIRTNMMDTWIVHYDRNA